MSDHKVVITELKSGCQLRIKKYVSSEAYQLASFLSSANRQLQFAKETNRLGAELKGVMDMELDEINDKTIEGLKRISKAEVGLSIKTRVTDTRVHTGVKEIVTTLRANKVYNAEVNKLKVLGDTNIMSLQRTRR